MIHMPTTAMVLAAGLGTRMRPLTDTTAKPLLEVAGRKLMDYLLDALVAAGVQRCVVNVHWCADQVEAHLSARKDVEILISDERSELLETGGGLARARPLLGEAPVFVVNTDAFWGRGDPAPLLELARGFQPAQMDELLLLADTGRCLGYKGAGDFLRSEAGVLTRRGDAPCAPYAYAGVRILKPQLYDAAPVEPFSANQIWNTLLPRGRVYGAPLEDFWLHVGDPQALKDAEMWIRCYGG